ncbi:MraY family glycosyltransferase [Christiangramia sp. OXR-203]|uniref:glycosyltransferase family 4 protein n=1 Tax=Christiangramia sp. OXR-203 TaxID=3100176 RepID=UPI002AC91272|nr:MraY family glycosyltransferase [Christiangramia sp. OXR-203]WPY98249.1 MraY family glycosyltransferase [Christiangramia sp. OXR-203]
MNILDHQVLLDLFHSNFGFFTASTFLLAFILTWYFIPKVLWVSQEKRLVTEINHRSSHTLKVPAFGGVAFFVVLILIICLLQSLRTSFTGNHLIIGLTLLFMAGLKDDLVISTAKLKLVSQVFAAGFIIFSPELHLESLNGFLGIGNLPLIAGYILKLFIVVALINAYNLIDGIDGLASIAGIVICSVFSFVFFTVKEPYYVLISISVVGILAAFLRFNFSNSRRKIFMGDGGSLIIGFIIAFLSLKILVMKHSPEMMAEGFMPENRPLFLLSVLFLPVFDTLRVMIIRLRNGKSPFEADRNHLHHVMLDNKMSHVQASMSLGFINLGVVGVYILAGPYLNSMLLSGLMLVGFVFMALVFETLKKRAEYYKEHITLRPNGVRIKLRKVLRAASIY